MFYLILSITFFIILISYLIRWSTYWERQGIKGPKFYEYHFSRNSLQHLSTQFAQTYGKVYGSYGFFERLLIVNDPDIVKELLITRYADCPDHRDFNFGPIMDRNLFSLPGNHEWKVVRSLINPAFTSSKLKTMIAQISEITDKFVENLVVVGEKGQPIEFFQYIRAYTLDILSTLVYGIKVDSIDNPNHPLVVNVEKLLTIDIDLSKLISVLMPRVARFFKIQFFDKRACQFFADLTRTIISEKRKSIGNSKNSDMMQTLIDSTLDADNDLKSEIKSKNTRKNNLSVRDLIAQGAFFFPAGSDTTATGIAHSIFHLSKNRECQRKLREELKTVEEFSYENLSQLKYLNAVINESLRFASPVMRMSRKTNKDMEIKGIKIPAGTNIEIVPYAIHMDPDYWTDPLEFKPERFFEPTHHPGAYLPFGDGPRICVGQQFALNEIRLFLAKIILNFDLSLAPGFDKLDLYVGNPLNTPKRLEITLKSI